MRAIPNKQVPQVEGWNYIKCKFLGGRPGTKRANWLDWGGFEGPAEVTYKDGAGILHTKGEIDPLFKLKIPPDGITYVPDTDKNRANLRKLLKSYKVEEASTGYEKVTDDDGRIVTKRVERAIEVTKGPYWKILDEHIDISKKPEKILDAKDKKIIELEEKLAALANKSKPAPKTTKAASTKKKISDLTSELE